MDKRGDNLKETGFIWELNRGFEGFGDFFEDFSKVFDVKTLKEKSAEI